MIFHSFQIFEECFQVALWWLERKWALKGVALLGDMEEVLLWGWGTIRRYGLVGGSVTVGVGLEVSYMLKILPRVSVDFLLPARCRTLWLLL